jgi:probable selenium-dependent hydroxylase accessory protein YqeC
MYALAEEASNEGLDVLVTTTTRIWKPNCPLVIGSASERIDIDLEREFQGARVVAAGAAISDDGKLNGLVADVVCALKAPDVIVCEADGASGRSIKFHRPHEPVVPQCTTHLIAVAGVDAVGATVEAAAHPADLASNILEKALNDIIEPEDVVQSILESSRFAPPGSRVHYVLNKVDSAEAMRNAERIRTLLSGRIRGELVIFTHLGRPVGAGQVDPPYTSA